MELEYLMRNGVKCSNNSDACLVSYMSGKQYKQRAIDMQQEVVLLVRKEHGAVINSTWDFLMRTFFMEMIECGNDSKRGSG